VASDIVPIQLSLTEGDLVTLWAPKWREDGEEWEAFLGDDDALFAFPSVAQLAAFVRTEPEHDLADHPAWSLVPDLTVAELTYGFTGPERFGDAVAALKGILDERKIAYE